MTENWKNVQNEGGEGYIPHYWTKKEYEDAVLALGALKGGVA